jgi:hypothetical protein
VDEAVDALQETLKPLWKRAAKEGPEVQEVIATRLREILAGALRRLLQEAYPEARDLLR